MGERCGILSNAGWGSSSVVEQEPFKLLLRGPTPLICGFREYSPGDADWVGSAASITFSRDAARASLGLWKCIAIPSPGSPGGLWEFPWLRCDLDALADGRREAARRGDCATCHRRVGEA